MPVLGENDIQKINQMWNWFKGMVQGGQGPPQPQRVTHRTADTQVVRVTSATATAGRYPAKIQAYDSVAKTYSDLATCWVVDVRGSVPEVQRYIGRRTGDVSGVPVFQIWHLTDTDTDTVYVLTVEDDANLISVVGVDHINLDTEPGSVANGLSLTDDGSGEITISLALAGNPTNGAGAVSNGTQTFGGEKTFALRTFFTAGAGGGEEADDYWQGLGRDTDNRIRCFDAGSEGALPESGQLGTMFQQINTPTGGQVAGFGILSAGSTLKPRFSIFSASGDPRYSIYDGSSHNDGVAGTDPIGNVFLGGIVTEIGDGFTELDITRDDSGASDPVLNINQDNATDTSPAMRINQDGSGDILQLQADGSTVVSVDDEGQMGVGMAPFAGANLAVGGAIRIDDGGNDGAGSNTIAAASYFYVGDEQGGGAFQYNADGGLDWHLFDGSWTRPHTFTKEGNVGFGTNSPTARLEVYRNDNTSTVPVMHVHNDHASSSEYALEVTHDGTGFGAIVQHGGANGAGVSMAHADGFGMRVTTGSTSSSIYALLVDVGATPYLRVRGDGQVMLENLPTSDPGIAGALWRSTNTVMVSTG